jgi:hypothetical protein
MSPSNANSPYLMRRRGRTSGDSNFGDTHQFPLRIERPMRMAAPSGRPRLFTILVNLRAKDSQIASFCRREFGSRSRDLARPMFIHRTKPKPEGFGTNSPGPSGFRLAANHFVRRHRTMETHRPRHLPRGLSRHPRNRTGSIWISFALKLPGLTYG